MSWRPVTPGRPRDASGFAEYAVILAAVLGLGLADALVNWICR